MQARAPPSAAATPRGDSYRKTNGSASDTVDMSDVTPEVVVGPDRRRKNAGRLVDWHSRWIFPAAYAVFNVVYWLLYAVFKPDNLMQDQTV